MSEVGQDEAQPNSKKQSKGCEDQGQFKISSLARFCVRYRSEWIAVFKLTDEQLREYRAWRNPPSFSPNFDERNGIR